MKSNTLQHLLSIVSEVRPGEASRALMLAANLFVLLASYYVLKTVREALILTEAGAQVKSYAAAGQALLLLLVIPAYSFVVSRVSRGSLLTWVTSFFIANLAIFYVLGQAGFRIGVPFYIWLGVFNVLVVAQFWAFVNDLYDSQSGERLFPIIGIGSALGAWLGARGAARLFKTLDPYELILIAAGGLLVSVLIARTVETGAVPAPKTRPHGKGSFQLVLSNRYLLLIAVMVLLFNLVNSLGEYMLGQMVVADAQRAVAAGEIEQKQLKARIGAFYGDFFGWVNLVGLVLQVLVVSRLFKHAGVRMALFVLPIIALGSYSLMAMFPMLGYVKCAKVLENGTDYSIQNTARHALFLPLDSDVKYKAKAAIDTFFWRVGDMLQAGVTVLGSQIAIGMQDYARINLVLVVVWLMLTAGIAREHRRMAAGAPRSGASSRSRT